MNTEEIVIGTSVCHKCITLDAFITTISSDNPEVTHALKNLTNYKDRWKLVRQLGLEHRVHSEYQGCMCPSHSK